MLTESARVVAVEPGWLWVETVRRSTCGSCAAARGCGHGMLNKLGDSTRNYLKVSTDAFNQRIFKVDDEVTIAIPERLLLDSAAMVYGVPLLFTLAGAAVAAGVASEASDLRAVLGAACGFLAGLGLVRLHAWYRRGDQDLHPRLLGSAESS